MASFFSDLFDSITNQQVAPQRTIIPTNEALGQGFGALNSQIAPGLLAFNQALAPGLTDVQLGVTNQLDPSILGNLRGANKSILDQLALGGGLDQELQNQVITNALEGSAASGFGVGTGGRGLVARDLGLTSLDLIRRRQQDALAAGTQGMGLSNRLYDPARYTGLGAELGMAATGDIRDVQAAKDDLANVTENIRRQNFSSLINTGGRILGGIAGGIVGAYTGNAAGGVMAGQSIGGSLGGQTGVAGYGQRQSGGGSGAGAGGMFSSILNMGGGGGGGGYPYAGADSGVGFGQGAQGGMMYT